VLKQDTERRVPAITQLKKWIGSGPLAVVYCFQDFEIEYDKTPQLDKLVVHLLGVFLSNLVTHVTHLLVNSSE